MGPVVGEYIAGFHRIVFFTFESRISVLRPLASKTTGQSKVLALAVKTNMSVVTLNKDGPADIHRDSLGGLRLSHLEGGGRDWGEGSIAIRKFQGDNEKQLGYRRRSLHISKSQKLRGNLFQYTLVGQLLHDTGKGTKGGEHIARATH